ncbi:heme-binding uptake protein ChaN (Tiki superfamily) [Litoreibacter ponti]|uniref:Heme-binding uptake protein ChaN (Tiki superfamily) n=1 Tax=Litoreibacter ponti TaxID=1510457 RepID=A0A2T6BEE9_9RHOB|nr:ChaN family lipoprotein [Litoreibacter ponti]PTX54439.1 heme-binding uptake protein ChaN (Tiki superfamily) [Litoreibacter ponti]
MAAVAATTPINAEVLATSAFDVLRGADVVIAGELHDNPTHHINQAAIAAAIMPKALVFEMLSPAQADAGNAADWSAIDQLDAALGWSDSPWPDFAMYFPIFEAAPDAQIFGAALPPDTVRAAVGTGAAAQFDGPEAFDLASPLDNDEQSTRETLQAEAHCNALPEDMLGGMVEAQRLRDASFAQSTLDALQQTGGPVLVITGNGHARTDWGMPRYLKRAEPELSLISVGQLLEAQDDPPYDRWIITGAYDPGTGDPCAAFKSN